MVSELICLEIVRRMHGHSLFVTTTDHTTDPPKVSQSEHQHAETESGLIRPLLADYEMSAVDEAIRWLKLGGFLNRAGHGFRGPWAYTLSSKGLEVAESGDFPDEERALFNLIEPHAVFLAHQFTAVDDALELVIREHLEAAGFSVWDGKVDGLEPFRQAIMAKLRTARFFLCLLTHRAQLLQGGFASSVWLYQEVGAAVASGKSPLLLVENGMDSHYAGELQKTYEYIPFEREDFASVMPEVIRRFVVDLEKNAIPLPPRG